MSTFPANVESEIQPLIEPVECDLPGSVTETKKTKADKKAKQKKISKCNVKASIGNPWTTGLFDCHEDQTNVKDVVLQLRPKLSEKQLLVSVVAGTKLKDLQVTRSDQPFTKEEIDEVRNKLARFITDTCDLDF